MSRRASRSHCSRKRVCKRQFGRGQKRERGSLPPPRGDRHPWVICKPSFKGRTLRVCCVTALHFEQDSRDALEDIARNARISSWSTAAPGSPARDAATRSRRSSAGRVLRGPPAGACARPSSWWRRWRRCRRWARLRGMVAGGEDSAGGGGSGPRCGSGRGGKSDRWCGSGPGGSRTGGAGRAGGASRLGGGGRRM